jgi:hypothetical protein
MITIYRYAEDGFEYHFQNHLKNPVLGCHVFVEHVDTYLLTGIAEKRKNQQLHTKPVDHETIVLGRNMVYYVGDNGFGYPTLLWEKFDKNSEDSWIELPIWVVAENAKLIAKHDPVGHFGCEAILINT